MLLDQRPWWTVLTQMQTVLVAGLLIVEFGIGFIAGYTWRRR